jgi:hypothetical protein
VLGATLRIEVAPALETKTALKGTALIRALFLTVARLLNSTTGRRRSALLTGGGLIGVGRPGSYHLNPRVSPNVRAGSRRSCHQSVTIRQHSWSTRSSSFVATITPHRPTTETRIRLRRLLRERARSEDWVSTPAPARKVSASSVDPCRPFFCVRARSAFTRVSAPEML